MSGTFRSFVWDPLLLCSQMACMQGVFYTVSSSVILSSSLFGFTPSLATLFSATPARIAVFCQLLSSLACAFALSHVVQRAKQCLDFTCTIHLFHLIAICLYTHSFPTTLTWWLLQISSVVLCTILGEYLCMQIESREIKLVGVSKYDL